MKCNTCGYDDNGTGDTAHVCKSVQIVTTDRIDDELQRKDAALREAYKALTKIYYAAEWEDLSFLYEVTIAKIGKALK
jgi:hypothetical protein